MLFYFILFVVEEIDIVEEIKGLDVVLGIWSYIIGVRKILFWSSRYI